MEKEAVIIGTTSWVQYIKDCNAELNVYMLIKANGSEENCSEILALRF